MYCVRAGGCRLTVHNISCSCFYFSCAANNICIHSVGFYSVRTGQCTVIFCCCCYYCYYCFIQPQSVLCPGWSVYCPESLFVEIVVVLVVLLIIIAFTVYIAR